MAVADGQNNRIAKKPRERKTSKSLDKTKLVEALENDESNPGSELRIQEKRAQGVVIDGKTYTCATCKAGHRVGVCKHAKERPMKATHPPGRPSAGAPKKVICDCPKNCSCLKKDCKCARKCNCTQVMFMLVYIPAPGEDEIVDDEKGTWKIDKEVTTDLKGNILTPEQVRERQERKDALRSSTPAAARSRSTSITTTKQEESKSCCKHKENVVSRNISASPSGTRPTASTGGCNCGHTCSCAFCPQHPNNATSVNVAREQAIHFANNHSANSESMVAFIPTMPQSISCMGGQPRFAMSRTADRPSFAELQHMFPNPGFVIGYPVHPNGDIGLGMGPYHMDNVHTMPDMSSFQPLQMPPGPTMNFSQSDFSIGNAFVASAGNGNWNNDMIGIDRWTYSIPTEANPFAEVEGVVDYMSPSTVQSTQLANIPTAVFAEPVETNHFENDLFVSDHHTENSTNISRGSCCQSSTVTPPLPDQFQYPPQQSPTIFDATHYGGLV